jgi:squalene-hopene/tetraprenyl-beta-curcumene cyclase
MSAPCLEMGYGERLEAVLERVTEGLMGELGPDGFWVGELSSSALSTATALIALSILRRRTGEEGDGERIRAGLMWLRMNQNEDGGWGDTVRSRSNISTSALVWSAFGACGVDGDGEFAESVARVEAWLKRASGVSAGCLEWRGKLAEAIRVRYGKDRTFSVPILMACVLSGRFGEGAQGWAEVPPLPFELAALPHRLFGALRLPVVSYALPALIAIGQVIHHHAPSRYPWVRWLREALRGKTLRVLASLQPRNGGFLEATPLTSFVLMALAAMGEGRGEVAVLASSFLRESVRADGSWPIDTNLATWLSTWSIQALRWQGGVLGYERRHRLREWLLGQQYRVEHPYTHAAPGGWAWTDLPGGVPDADDTPGAMLALLELGPVDAVVRSAGELATRWLLGLQNSDGGIPTFCRGWGALPFDRSSPDLTAHALRAWSAWLPQWTGELRGAVERAIERAVAFLQRTQDAHGGWVPLWFGNERSSAEVNPTYGTARVVVALRELRDRGFELPAGMLRRAEERLVGLQLADGGWGGGSEAGMVSSVEETGLAVEALAGTEHGRAVRRGAEWLLERVETERWREPAPIGFYFAKLWYFERLYPVILTVGALGAVRRFEKSA